MLSVQELEYVTSLINTYKFQGYKYYLCSTNSDTSNLTDIYLYLSKKEIKAINNSIFTIDNGIVVKIDDSYRYNEKNKVLTIENSVVGNVFTIDEYEYVYTNCKYDTTETTIVYPDMLLSNSSNFDTITFYGITSFMIISIFLYLFTKSILRIRR